MAKLLRPFLLFLSRFSTLLPQTIEDFDKFYQDLVALFKLPDSDDSKEIIATAVLHLDQTTSKKPKIYFARYLQKSLANKAAFDTMKKIKDERKAQDGPSEAPPVQGH